MDLVSIFIMANLFSSVWRSCYISYKLWYAITYPLPNMEWMCRFFSHSTGRIISRIITYSCWYQI